ncbi:hypothetical protein [Streptomyces aidingensis]|uniref:Uncharacterized protein n=1 Tax=Streptomyces aidingensis TaxID=910347 RepID=A0A1I1FZF8_9ACTN|nr:hypothetical protein [Streptomyces aidingensis]SFC02320.1 hypothetical protein SAMN05421773_101854 [Streptomyces aidingensis]
MTEAPPRPRAGGLPPLQGLLEEDRLPPGTLLKITVQRDPRYSAVGEWIAEDPASRGQVLWRTRREGGDGSAGHLFWLHDGSRLFTGPGLLEALVRAAGTAPEAPPAGPGGEPAPDAADWLLHGVSGRSLRALHESRAVSCFGGPREGWKVPVGSAADRHHLFVPGDGGAGEGGWAPADAHPPSQARYVPKLGPDGQVTLHWVRPAALTPRDWSEWEEVRAGPDCPVCGAAGTYHLPNGWIKCRNCAAESH